MKSTAEATAGLRLFSSLLVIAALWALSSTTTARELNGFNLRDARVPVREIAQGGPPRDGIPAIDRPRFESDNTATWLDDKDAILGISQNGITKAYPVAILNWHEVVNDTFGDSGVLVSYCPLCGTGMAFQSDIAGERLSFGVSGLLYRSDVLFYDRQSESLWSQLDRVAISGVKRDQALVQLPMEHVAWGQWRKRHPDTLLLSRDQGFRRDYTDDPYAGYEKTKRLFFQVAAKIPKRYHTKERVLGLRSGQQAIALPFIEMREQGKASFTLDFDNRPITILWNEAESTARALDANGDPVVHTIAFWFAWYAFHPGTQVFSAASP